MLWVGKPAFDLFLGTTRQAIFDGPRKLWNGSHDTWQNGLAGALQHLRESSERRNVRVWLSGSLCRPFLLGEASGLKERAELLIVAKSLVAPRTGLPADSEVWLDPSPSGMPAVAVPVDVITAIYAAFKPELARRWWPRRAKHSVATIQPWWCEALRSAIRSNASSEGELGAIGIYDGESFTWLAGAGNSFNAANTATSVRTLEEANKLQARARIQWEGQTGSEMGLALNLDAEPVQTPWPCALGHRVVSF